MEIFITGGGGFVGGAVAGELLARGCRVKALVHHREPPPHPALMLVRGDMFQSKCLAGVIRGCDAVIHLVGIIAEQPGRGITFRRVHVEGTESVIDAARKAGVRRYLHMSALGARQEAVSAYHKTKFQAEQAVHSSGLDWTIFRPSLIHGPGGEFTQMETQWARGERPPYFFMPYFGNGLLGTRGGGKIQPVYVNDVAKAIALALQAPQALGKTYELAGPQVFTWPELHQQFAKTTVGWRRPAAAIPAWWAMAIASTLPASILPFNADQVIMSLEDNVTQSDQAQRDLGWAPLPLEAALQEYAAEL